MRDILIRKYILDILLVVIVVSLLTWFWFGPYQSKVRIRESLMSNNLAFNKDISYSGFDNISLSNNKITKDLVVTNDSDKLVSFVISFDNLTNNKNNYINYIITDDEGYSSDIRCLSTDGYILENSIDVSDTKNYKITIWSDSLDINGNLELILMPVYA